MDNVTYAVTVDLDLGSSTTYDLGATFPDELITQTSHTLQLTLQDSAGIYDISGITASTVKIKKNDSTASATTLATGTLTTDGTDGRIDFVINKDLIPASLAAFPQSPNRPVILYYITIEDADSKIQVRKLITVYDIDGTGTASANPEAADFDYTPTTAGDWTSWNGGVAPALVGTALDDTAEWINDTGILKLDTTGGTMTGILREAKGADVASATALTLGTDGNFFDITGTTTITSIATLGIGSQVTLQFDDALIITHHATDLILQGTNITTVAGDSATFIEYATGDWLMLSYRRADSSIKADVAGTVSTLNRTGTDGKVISIEKDGTELGVIGVKSSELYMGKGITGFYYAEGVNSITPWDSDTNLLSDGLTDLGYTTARFKDLYLSGGAYLGGTASNNLLSAMDRQSFTPTFTNFTIGNGSAWGYYQTINDVCYAICGFVMGSTSSVTGTLKLTGLPETSSANAGSYYPAQISMIDSGSAFYGGHSMVNASSTITQSFYDFSNAVLNGTNPFTWTTNDSLTFKTSYPIY